MDQNKFDLLKSHINAFTRKDGAVVAAHDDKRVAAQAKPDAYGHPNVVGKPSHLIQDISNKAGVRKETPHTGKPTDAPMMRYNGKLYFQSNRTAESFHDKTPVTRYDHYEDDDGDDEGTHRVWMDDQSRIHADSTTEVKGLRAEYENHQAKSKKKK